MSINKNTTKYNDTSENNDTIKTKYTPIFTPQLDVYNNIKEGNYKKASEDPKQHSETLKQCSKNLINDISSTDSSKHNYIELIDKTILKKEPKRLKKKRLHKKHEYQEKGFFELTKEVIQYYDYKVKPKEYISSMTQRKSKQKKRSKKNTLTPESLENHESYPEVKTQCNITLEPNSMQTIELVCEVNRTKIDDIDKGECIFQPTNLYTQNHNYYGIVMQPTLSNVEKISEEKVKVTAIIMNTNNDSICLEKETVLGVMEDISNNNINIQMKEDDFNSLLNHIAAQETTEHLDIFTEEEPESEGEISSPSSFYRKDSKVNDSKQTGENNKTELKQENEVQEESFDIKMTSVPEELKEELMNIVGNEMKSVWTKQWNNGETNIKHDIITEDENIFEGETEQNSSPGNQGNKDLNSEVKYKIVTPASSSKMTTNIVLVQKPAQQEIKDSFQSSQNRTNFTWRIAQDVRGVYSDIKEKFTNSLPTIDKIVSNLSNKIVTQLNMTQADVHVPLTQHSKEHLYLHGGIHEWSRIAQGLVESPHRLMRNMKLIFCEEIQIRGIQTEMSRKRK